MQQFRYGNGTAKVDFALSGPVPWSVSELQRAGTIHVGGTRAEIAHAESNVARGRHAAAPFVLVAQPSPFDGTRAPDGQQVLWSYAHVPSGSTIDQTETVVRQIERFAPGFRDLILATHSRTATETARYNANYIGGDIAAGAPDIAQLIARPVLSPDPWRTPVDGLYLCSSVNPSRTGRTRTRGWYAARSALKHEFGIRTMPDLSR